MIGYRNSHGYSIPGRCKTASQSGNELITFSMKSVLLGSFYNSPFSLSLVENGVNLKSTERRRSWKIWSLLFKKMATMECTRGVQEMISEGAETFTDTPTCTQINSTSDPVFCTTFE